MMDRALLLHDFLDDLVALEQFEYTRSRSKKKDMPACLRDSDLLTGNDWTVISHFRNILKHFENAIKALEEMPRFGRQSTQFDSLVELIEWFATLGLGKKYNVRAPGSRLFVSAEFTHTIENGSEGPNDNFLRPIEWVLWGPVHGTALVIIPEEVELLIPVIRAMERAPVHLIPYAASTTNNMVHSSELAGYVLPSPLLSSPLPSWLSIELGLLGARLYFDFEEYSMLLKYLRSVLKVGSTASAGAASGVRKID
ncbi:very large low complexity protein [Hirsutella rhossiliensis]